MTTGSTTRISIVGSEVSIDLVQPTNLSQCPPSLFEEDLDKENAFWQKVVPYEKPRYGVRVFQVQPTKTERTINA